MAKRKLVIQASDSEKTQFPQTMKKARTLKTKRVVIPGALTFMMISKPAEAATAAAAVPTIHVSVVQPQTKKRTKQKADSKAAVESSKKSSSLKIGAVRFKNKYSLNIGAVRQLRKASKLVLEL